MKTIGWVLCALGAATLGYGCGTTSSPVDGSGDDSTPTLKDGCDRAITSVSAATGTAGGDATVEYTVASLGKTCGPDFSTSLDYVHDGVPWSAAEVLGNDFVIGLAAGDTQSRTVTLPVRADTAAGTYEVRVHVDPADVDASNDAALATLRITSSIQCSDDAYEPDNDEAAPRALTLGTAETHNFCFDSIDYASFEVTTTSSYVIDIAFAGGGSSPGVLLIDPATSNYVTMGSGDAPFHYTFVPNHAGIFVLEMFRSIDLGSPDLDYTCVVNEVARP